MSDEGIQRIGTGVEGLDEIIGGYPVGRSILITGDAGSGKTIMRFSSRSRAPGQGSGPFT